jgi:hypothetical protein
MTQSNYVNIVDLDIRDVLNLTEKQRLKLLANLIADKIKEDIRQGSPLLKRIEAEEAKTLKKKSNIKE